MIGLRTLHSKYLTSVSFIPILLIQTDRGFNQYTISLNTFFYLSKKNLLLPVRLWQDNYSGKQQLGRNEVYGLDKNRWPALGQINSEPSGQGLAAAADSATITPGSDQVITEDDTCSLVVWFTTSSSAQARSGTSLNIKFMGSHARVNSCQK
jgi:hypothetical protein